MSTEMTVAAGESLPAIQGPAFADASAFELAQRMAKALVASDLVPQQFRGEKGIANTLIALEMAWRTHASPLAVMQNLYIVQLCRPGQADLERTVHHCLPQCLRAIRAIEVCNRRRRGFPVLPLPGH
jgi:hypothetical protein